MGSYVTENPPQGESWRPKRSEIRQGPISTTRIYDPPHQCRILMAQCPTPKNIYDLWLAYDDPFDVNP
jgi:hypothetical protein